MNLEAIHNVYFLGIGGIGMSALARYFHAGGWRVAGYDLTPSPLTEDLQKLGINIHFDDDIDRVPEPYLDKEDTLIIRTPAIPENLSEYLYFAANSYTIRKRSEILGILFNRKRGIAIAGTHGKTSVSSMTGYILDVAEQGCTAFLGGILKNIGSNLILNPESDWVVAEADEFDRSFLQLKPELALITWMDADHLDIYESRADIEQAFTEFAGQVKAGGSLILKKGVTINPELEDYTLLSYSLDDESADFHAKNIRLMDGWYVFDIVTPKEVIREIRLSVIGKTNVENAVAAAALTCSAGVDSQKVKMGLSSFQGVRRRFDIRFHSDDYLYIDDYAHHPRELDAVIGSVRDLFPGRKLTGIFQPHLYSRTRDFADEFAVSLSALDELILLEIYPAREDPVPGVSSQLIFNKVRCEVKVMCSKENLLETIKSKKLEVLLTMGAGDIDRFAGPLTEILAKQ